MSGPRIPCHLAALVRKLHAAELQHLRDVVAEQQAKIEAQAQHIEALEREATWEYARAEMFADQANAAGGDTAKVGITPSGAVGALQ